MNSAIETNGTFESPVLTDQEVEMARVAQRFIVAALDHFDQRHRRRAGCPSTASGAAVHRPGTGRDERSASGHADAGTSGNVHH